MQDLRAQALRLCETVHQLDQAMFEKIARGLSAGLVEDAAVLLDARLLAGKATSAYLAESLRRTEVALRKARTLCHFGSYLAGESEFGNLGGR